MSIPTSASATHTTAMGVGVAPEQHGTAGSQRDEVDCSNVSHTSNNSSRSSRSGNNTVHEIRPEETEGVRYGKCKWFNVAKGWGFITPNDGGQEVFVHQSVIQMNGFRSLGEKEEVEFECKITGRGLEATRVSGRQGNDCHGSTFRPRIKRRFRRIRCYNCGEFANHIASKCELGPQPKTCHLCKQSDHLFADCPLKQTQTSPQQSAVSSAGTTNESSPSKVHSEDT